MAGFRNREDTGTELTAAEILWIQTGEAGVLLLTEQASAPSATPGVGKIYTKSSDSNLYYLNDSGVETQLNGGGGVTVITPTGTVDGLNTVFAVGTSAPKWVVSDTNTYFPGLGYSYSSPNITMDVAPSYGIRAII